MHLKFVFLLFKKFLDLVETIKSKFKRTTKRYYQNKYYASKITVLQIKQYIGLLTLEQIVSQLDEIYRYLYWFYDYSN